MIGITKYRFEKLCYTACFVRHCAKQWKMHNCPVTMVQFTSRTLLHLWYHRHYKVEHRSKFVLHLFECLYIKFRLIPGSLIIWVCHVWYICPLSIRNRLFSRASKLIQQIIIYETEICITTRFEKVIQFRFNHWWFFFYLTIGNKLQRDFGPNRTLVMHENGSENIVSKWRPQECLFNSLFGLTSNKHQRFASLALCDREIPLTKAQ